MKTKLFFVTIISLTLVILQSTQFQPFDVAQNQTSAQTFTTPTIPAPQPQPAPHQTTQYQTPQYQPTPYQPAPHQSAQYQPAPSQSGQAAQIPPTAQPAATNSSFSPVSSHPPIPPHPPVPPYPPVSPRPPKSVPPTVESLDKLREIYVPVNELGTIFESAKNSLLIKRNEFEQLRKNAREVLLETDRNKTKTKSPIEAILLSSDYKINIADLRAIIEGIIEIEILTDDIVAIPFQFDRVSIIEATNLETQKPAALNIIGFTYSSNLPNSNSNANSNSNSFSNANTNANFNSNTISNPSGFPINQTGVLILQGKKRHKIKLVATTPLEIDSTRQRIAFRLLHSPKNTLHLTIPGDVELKSGASVISRKVEQKTDDKNTKLSSTQFDLLTKSDSQQTDITMSLNSHKTGAYQAVLARSVQFAEITEQYERLHATISLTEMHQGIAEAIFEIPEGFEITDVASILLDKWNVEKNEISKNENAKNDNPKNENAKEKNLNQNPKRDKLKLKFREQTAGLTTIYLSAIKVNRLTDDKSAEWRFPLFTPLNVAANSTVLGLLVEQELETTDLVSEKLHPIDPLTLQDAIPPSALNAAPGSPLIRLASAWYAPREQFAIKAKFKRPKSDCKVAAVESLALEDKTPTLKADYSITALSGKIFETIIETPKNWKISSIKTRDNISLEFREVNADKTAPDKQQFLVQFPIGIIAGESFNFTIIATGKVDGWFTTEAEKKIVYPLFNVVGATNSQGKIGIYYGGEEDYDIIPIADENLIPLDNSVKKDLFPNRHEFAEYSNQVIKPVFDSDKKFFKPVLAYEYFAKPFKFELKLEKLKPRLNVKVTSIYSFAPTLLNVNHELWFTAKHASTQRISFLLPIETPSTASIEKINDMLPTPIVITPDNPALRNGQIKQSEIKETLNSEVEIDGKKFRRWEILLSKPQADLLIINVNYDLQIDPTKNKTNVESPYKLPRIIAENIAWQSDFIAIQGDEELDLQVLTDTNNSPENNANAVNAVNANVNNTTKIDGKFNALRSVDVGTISEMHNQPSERLIGFYSLIQDDGEVAVMMRRNELLSLVTAVVEKVTIIAQLGNSVQSGTLYCVDYDIYTDSASAQILLGEKDEIWSVKIDGQAIKPQRVGNAILIPIQQLAQIQNGVQNNRQAANPNRVGRLRKIELVYRRFNNPLKDIQLSFPTLTVKRSGENFGVPVMQTQWKVIPPNGYNVTKIGNKVVEDADKFNPAVLKIINFGSGIIGDIFGINLIVDSKVSSPSSGMIFLENSMLQEKAFIGVESALTPMSDDSSGESLGDKNEENNKVVVNSNNKDKEMSADQKKSISGREERYVTPTDNMTDESKLVADSNGPLSILGRQPMRRLKSVQPVTVFFAGDYDSGSGVDYSQIGTSGIQEVSVNISSLSSRTLLGWFSYLGVLLVGLLFIKSDYIKKSRFVFGVFFAGTILVFIPY
ncbi:MAG: acid shock protein, partial [Planctomycetaceae bacterium]|nr:acid shock protein [Planctomycetaceae bacterium]